MKRKPLPEGAPGEVEPDNDADDKGPMSPAKSSVMPRAQGPGSALMTAIGKGKKRKGSYTMPGNVGGK